MHVDFFSPATRANPYPLYAHLRAERPVTEVAPGMWAIARAADVINAIKDTRTFSNAGFRATVAPEWIDNNLISETLFLMDPPEHTQFRQALSRAFGKKLTQRMADCARASVQGVCRSLPVGEPFDFVADFSQAYVNRVMAQLLGLDEQVRAKMHDFSLAQVHITPTRLEPETERWVKRSVAGMQDDLRAVLQQQRRLRSNELVIDLIDARVDGAPLTDDQIVGFMALLVGAGLETTVNAFSNSAMLLSDRPELFASLRRDPNLIPAFAAEILRFDPPTHALLRLATDDVKVAGEMIPKGALVMLLTASAHRDPEFCADGDVFRLDRQSSSHMAFGHGAHSCIGASLATMELKVGLAALTSHFCGISTSMGAQDLNWNQHLAARGPLDLTVTLSR